MPSLTDASAATGRLPGGSSDYAYFNDLHAGDFPATRLRIMAINAIKMLAAWRQRSQERRWLAAMDDRLRSDIGVSKADIYRELRKPFWIP
jgi:uncharacterized protein YjiS (DUF1127 family)